MVTSNTVRAARSPKRQPWTAPQVKHLAASGAEFGVATNNDAEGFS